MATPKHTPAPRWLKSSGNAVLGLIRDPRYDDRRMAPVLRLTDDRGGEVVIQLTHQEIDDLRADAAKLFNADQEHVTAWWESFSDGPDKRPHLPAARLPSPDATDHPQRRAQRRGGGDVSGRAS
jgi:hypothetical protein